MLPSGAYTSSVCIVTQTWGCACARPMPSIVSSAVKRMRNNPFMGAHNIMDCGANVACYNVACRLSVLSQSGPSRSAVGTRVVATFQAATGMQHNCPCVAHRVGISFIDNRDIVACRQQAVDQIPVEARFQPQVGMGRTPGPAEQPARRIE